MTQPNSGLPGSGPGSQATPTSSGLPSYNDLPVPGQTTSTSSTLPDGTTDWWNLGALYDKPVLMGTQSKVTEYDHGPHGQLVPLHDTAPVTKKTQDLMKQIMQMAGSGSPDYQSIQGLLYDAGFYGDAARKSVHWGMWNSQTADAVKAALNSYEQLSQGAGVPLTWSDFLKQQAASGRSNQAQGGVGGGTTGTPSQVQLTDPATLTGYAQQAAQAALGRNLSPDQVQAFVSSFQSQQQSAQSSTAASVTAPDASAQAMQFVQHGNESEFGQHNVQAYSNALLNLFLGSAGTALPTVAPTPAV